MLFNLREMMKASSRKRKCEDKAIITSSLLPYPRAHNV